jgi:hypothetical protein
VEHLPIGEPPGLTILRPGPGEEIASGSPYVVRWSPGSAGSFTLRFSPDGGITWRTVGRVIGGTSFRWRVPVPAENLGNCLLRIIARGPDGKVVQRTVSAAPFAVRVVKVDSFTPNFLVFNSYDAATLHWQTWRTKARVARVRIEYTLDDGETWTRSTLIKGNPGLIFWSFPLVEDGIHWGCRVRVTLLDRRGRSLGSDVTRFFALAPPLSPWP